MAELSKFFRIRLFFSKFRPRQCRRHFLHSIKSELLQRLCTEINKDQEYLCQHLDFAVLKSSYSKLVVLEIRLTNQRLFDIASSIISTISRIHTWSSFHCSSIEVRKFPYFMDTRIFSLLLSPSSLC